MPDSLSPRAQDIERAIKASGAKQLVFLTDFYSAAKGSAAKEEEQGKLIVDAVKAAGCIEFTVFISVADVEACAKHRPKAMHMRPKGTIEAYLKASGLDHAVLRPGEACIGARNCGMTQQPS